MENMEKVIKEEGAKLKPRQFQFEVKNLQNKRTAK